MGLSVQECSPIVLFVYNRPIHTQKTIEALKNNDLASNSDLIIFSDAPKDEMAIQSVLEVRDYIRTIDGFKTISIIEREKNWGLAKSIINGVSDVVNKYGKVIVLEDDIVTSPAFLQFMNQALNHYQNEHNVWHISGWNYPINKNQLDDAFLWRGMNCWGWGTWADRWQYFNKNPDQIIKNWSKSEKYRFDLDGSGIFWKQVLANAKGKINTWAIFWYASIFQHQGLCLNPTVSYVNNIGHDGSGVHCGIEATYRTSRLCSKVDVSFPDKLAESELAVSRIINFYKKQRKPLHIRLIKKVRRMFVGRNIAL